MEFPMDRLAEWRTEGLAEWRTEGLAEWRTEGLTNGRKADPIFKRIFFKVVKRDLKNPGEIRQYFFFICRSPMEKGRIEFSISFLEPGEILK